jgi:hypothetical protein
MTWQFAILGVLVSVIVFGFKFLTLLEQIHKRVLDLPGRIRLAEEARIRDAAEAEAAWACRFDGLNRKGPSPVHLEEHRLPGPDQAS